MRQRSSSRRKRTRTSTDRVSPESMAALRDDLSSAVDGLKSTIQLTGSLLRSFAAASRPSNAFEASTVAQSSRPRTR